MLGRVELKAAYVARSAVWFLIEVDFPDDDRDAELVMQSRPDVDKKWDVVDDALLDVMRNAAISCRNELEHRWPPHWLLKLHETGGGDDVSDVRVLDLPQGLTLQLPVPTT